MSTKMFLYIVVALGLHGCDRNVRPNIEGSYSFQNAELQESLELRAGGTFTQQVIIDGTTFNSTGEWLFEGSRRIVLREFFVRFDTSSRRIIVPPQKYGAYIGFWNPQRKRIEFDEEGGYYLQNRTQKENQTPSRGMKAHTVK